MGECFTCEGAADDRFTMILNADTVLDDVVMCDACHDSYAAVPWIEVEAAPVVTDEGSPYRASGAVD